VASAIAVVCGTLAFAAFRRTPDHVADFDQLWHASRALFDGRDPYSAVGPGRAFDFPWPLYYPVPALLIVAPLVVLPLLFARVALVCIGAWLLAYATPLVGFHALMYACCCHDVPVRENT